MLEGGILILQPATLSELKMVTEWKLSQKASLCRGAMPSLPLSPLHQFLLFAYRDRPARKDPVNK
jgi:hypothetical protein